MNWASILLLQPTFLYQLNIHEYNTTKLIESSRVKVFDKILTLFQTTNGISSNIFKLFKEEQQRKFRQQIQICKKTSNGI